MPATDACASKTLEIQTLLQGMNAVSTTVSLVCCVSFRDATTCPTCNLLAQPNQG